MNKNKITKEKLIEMINAAKLVEITVRILEHRLITDNWAIAAGDFNLYFRVDMKGFHWDNIMDSEISTIIIAVGEGIALQYLELDNNEVLYLRDFVGTNKESEAVTFVKEWISRSNAEKSVSEFSKINCIKADLQPIIDKMKNQTHGARNQLIRYITSKMIEDLEVKEGSETEE